jgi:hypothetical protein
MRALQTFCWEFTRVKEARRRAARIKRGRDFDMDFLLGRA